MSKTKKKYELVVITTSTKVKDKTARRVEKRRSSGTYETREELDAAIGKQQQKETPHFEVLLYGEGKTLTYKKQAKNYRLTTATLAGDLADAPQEEESQAE
tara:strand:- start:2326 stop:2628 length:303 start_codon:yes stop_codon:yes gene_type:complete